MNDVKDLTGKIINYPEITIYTDGACEPINPGGVACCSWAIFHLNTVLAEQALVVKDDGPLATNNYAEYCGLGFALNWLVSQNWTGKLQVFSDSQLLVNQVMGKWKCNSPHLQALRKRIYEHLHALNLCLPKIFDEVSARDIDVNKFSITWVPREKNEYTDLLARKAFEQYKAKNHDS